jgi:polysaccharide biosynthesis transport protein
MSKATTDPGAHAIVPAAMKTPTERMRDFAAALRRRWPAALLVFVLTVASAAVLTTMQHKKYDATAQILLQPTDAERANVSPGSVASPADAQRDVNTYAQLITVDPVTNAVRRQLGLSTTLQALVSQIRISGQETSNLVTITARDSSPTQAARLATAFATQYQLYRRQTALLHINQALATTEANRQAKVDGSAVALRVQQLQAAAASETGGVQIIRPASVPGSPASPKVRTSIVVGFIAALILAAITVLALEAIDRRLLGGPQFQAAFGAPVLAAIPDGRRWSDATSRQAERRRAYTDLAARLAFTSVAKSSRAIMISPASKRGGAGAGALALALTEALCVLGRRVVLIEADLGGRLALRAGESDERGGLTSVLTGRSSFKREVTDVHFVAGSVANRRELEPWALVSYSTLPSGPRVAEPEALLGRAAMQDVLEEAKARGDLVLVLTGALDQPSGVLPLARLCDGVIVLAQRSMKADQAREIVDLLSMTGVPLLGTVLIPADCAEEGSTGARQDFAGLAPRAERASVNGNGEHSHASAATPRGD